MSMHANGLDPEIPEADFVEQQLPVDPHDEAHESPVETVPAPDASEADWAEQQIEVPLEDERVDEGDGV